MKAWFENRIRQPAGDFCTPNRGFTLVELVVVISVLVLAASVMVPAFIKFHQRAQMRMAARRTIALAAEARGLAISRDTGVTLVYDRGAHGLRMSTDPLDPDAEGEANPRSLPSGGLRTGDVRLLEYPLDVDVKIERPDPEAAPVLRFLPDGTARTAVMTFSRSGFDTFVLGLNPRTGRMRLQP